MSGDGFRVIERRVNGQLDLTVQLMNEIDDLPGPSKAVEKGRRSRNDFNEPTNYPRLLSKSIPEQE